MEPLKDIRVIAIEQYGAGPYGSLHLADLGAEVIKIETPGSGDVGRSVPPFQEDGDSLFFETFNRNKRSLALDVLSDGGREVMRDLAAASDVVYSNLRGDVPAKLGITYDRLAEVNPRIVCCSLSGFGMTGPRQKDPGFDYMLQGLAGWMRLTGDPDSPPTKSGLSLVDFSGGLVAACAIVSGVHAARRDGVGMDCDLSLFDTAISMLTYVATWQLTCGFEVDRAPRSAHPTLVPFQNFPTSDGWIVAGGAKQKFWERFAGALALGHLVDDPRFRDFQCRLENRDALIEAMDAVMTTDSTENWINALTAAGVPCAPVNTVAQGLSDPHVAARELVVETEHPRFGTVRSLASPVRVGAVRTDHTRAPRRSEHRDYVLQEVLGYAPSKVAGLIRDGVVE